MCGIVGYCTFDNNKISENLLIKMRDSLKHRGPDDAGIYISKDKKTGLAHRRLSIIDLSKNGHQPMCNEDETIWITYNGEIYNFKEIKEELLKKGHCFKSNTDTEVIIHAYEEYGFDCLNKFNGMFSFCLFDEKKNIFFLARDRFGIKPLYYGLFNGKCFVFASELKAIVLHPGFIKKIDYVSLSYYFKYRYIPSPGTIWENINKLPHGNYCIFNLNNKKITVKKYYSLIDKINNKRTSINDVKENLYKSVKRRLISDVEVGALLSGGIDSSSVTSIACKEHPYIKSFSIGFEPEEYSELPYSNIVASSLKTDHITEIVKNIDNDILDRLSYCYDEPLADSSCIPTYILCRMVSKKVKVALSGDGGDEVFSGYNWYKTFSNDYNNSSLNIIINNIRKLFGLKYKILPDFEKYYNKLLLNRFDDEKFMNFFSTEIYKQYKKNNENLFEKYTTNRFSNVRALQYVDLNTFMIDDILTKVDRASMAHSLEVRVPLLDYELVESVFCLDKNDFPENSVEKPILKKIMKNKIPDKIFNREKKGFSAPITSWEYYNKQINDIILNGNAIKDNLFNKQYIIDLINKKHVNSDGMLWMILIFEKWYQKWYY